MHHYITLFVCQCFVSLVCQHLCLHTATHHHYHAHAYFEQLCLIHSIPNRLSRISWSKQATTPTVIWTTQPRVNHTWAYWRTSIWLYGTRGGGYTKTWRIIFTEASANRLWPFRSLSREPRAVWPPRAREPRAHDRALVRSLCVCIYIYIHTYIMIMNKPSNNDTAYTNPHPLRLPLRVQCCRCCDGNNTKGDCGANSNIDS